MEESWSCAAAATLHGRRGRGECHAPPTSWRGGSRAPERREAPLTRAQRGLKPSVPAPSGPAGARRGSPRRRLPPCGQRVSLASHFREWRRRASHRRAVGRATRPRPRPARRRAARQPKCPTRAERSARARPTSPLPHRVACPGRAAACRSARRQVQAGMVRGGGGPVASSGAWEPRVVVPALPRRWRRSRWALRSARPYKTGMRFAAGCYSILSSAFCRGSVLECCRASDLAERAPIPRRALFCLASAFISCHAPSSPWRRQGPWGEFTKS